MNADRLHQLAKDLDAAICDAQMAEGSLLEALHDQDFALAHETVDQAAAANRRQVAIENERSIVEPRNRREPQLRAASAPISRCTRGRASPGVQHRRGPTARAPSR